MNEIEKKKFLLKGNEAKNLFSFIEKQMELGKLEHLDTSRMFDVQKVIQCLERIRFTQLADMIFDNNKGANK